MDSMLVVALLLVFIFLRIPVVIAMGLSTLTFLFFFTSIPLDIIAQQMLSTVDKFTLMAIPFFIVAGGIMEHGGISQRIINFANAAVGFLPGGLAMVMVFATMLFSGMTGSGAADAAAIGSILIPAMVKSGYSADFSCALQASAGVTGPLIPPSILAVLFGVSAGYSIGDLLLAGTLPGFLMGGLIMITAGIISVKRGYKTEKKFDLAELGRAFRDSIWGLLMPIILMGGIYSGIFTPTEAAAVSCLYSLFVGIFIYKELAIKDVPKVIYDSMILAAGIMVIVAASHAFSWIITRQGLPHDIAEWFRTVTSEPMVFLIFSSILLPIIGTFLDPAPATLIMAPILAPVAVAFGIDPIHYGIVMIAAMSIGLITPPIGLNFFVTSSITGRPVHKIIGETWPFLATCIFGLILIILFPKISLVLLNR